MALPNYLVHLQNQNNITAEIDVEEELNERVNSGDLDGGGDDARYFYDTMREFKLESSLVLLGADSI